MGVDLEKKRKLLLYPREYQRGCPMRVGFGICQGRRSAGWAARWRCLWAQGWGGTQRRKPFLSVSSASTTARGATTRTEVMRAGSNMGPGGQGEGGAQWAWT